MRSKSKESGISLLSVIILLGIVSITANLMANININTKKILSTDKVQQERRISSVQTRRYFSDHNYCQNLNFVKELPVIKTYTKEQLENGVTIWQGSNVSYENKGHHKVIFGQNPIKYPGARYLVKVNMNTIEGTLTRRAGVSLERIYQVKGGIAKDVLQDFLVELDGAGKTVSCYELVSSRSICTSQKQAYIDNSYSQKCLSNTY